ncbi:transposase [Candidatus Saccharibacteria bacterium]|jgi:putative transposase|nr:transposase [Candidatus Saccharibacteria bacterium]
MPHKNVIRHFESGATYHCYNRGVEKRIIFNDEQDYGVFLQRLKLMLADPEIISEDYPERQRLKSYYGDIELLSYCLMPNHFHLLLSQKTDHAIPEMMQTLSTSYTMYFNARNDRVGSLFQGRYKASRVDSDAYALHISRYIHLNPYDLPGGFERYLYSSMRYLAEPSTCPEWLNVEKVLENHYDSYEKYRQFVEEYANSDDFEYLEDDFSLA